MIALLTDFHTSDGVGLVRAVMKQTNPKSELVDLYNFVRPFAIRSGAWILRQDYSFFPKGTVFFCVVDPGVGGARKCIAVKTTNYYFVGPDNGLIHPAASADKIVKVVGLPIPKDASKTFHGRDVFAPAAAKLDAGIAIDKLGKQTSSIQQLDLGSNNGHGEIVLIEHYGNIVTNIPVVSKKSSYDVVLGHFKKNLKFHSEVQKALLVAG